jgi:hypothetical protein
MASACAIECITRIECLCYSRGVDEAGSLPQDVARALAAYRQDRSPARWTALSQLSVGDVSVLDALMLIEPDFPEPLPLPVEGLVTENADFFQWPELPEPDRVLQAITSALERKA